MMRCWAALLAVAAASKQKDSAPHDAKKKDPTGGASLVHAPKKPVAVCVSGLARAFYAVPRVQRNAWSHMVWPIVEEANVFFVLDASTRGRTGGVVDAAAAAALEREARALWRPVYDVALESAGLEESLAACFGAIAGRERARRRAYAWVLRLRPDATYGQALPRYSAFPDLAPGAAVAWAAYLGGATCGRGVPADFDRTGACLDDNWALLSRGAADAYFFGREWPLRGERAPDCVQTGCAECRLGCALRRAGARPGSVDVRLALERPRADGFYATDGPATAVDLAAAGIVEARLNFYWTWVPFIGGNLLAGLELFEQVAIAVGVLPNFELALRMCPAFSAAAGLATAGDWKIGALELAQVLFGALGVPVPAGESFRALQPSEGDGVPAKDDGETPRAAEKVGAADGAETPSMAPTKSKDMHFFATPVLTGAQTAPLMFKLSKAVTLVFDELLGAYQRRAAHAAKANPKPGEVDQFGAPLLPIESEGMDEIPAARVWATVAHYLAARGAAGLTKSTRNLDVLSPSGMDFDEQVATSPSGATAVHPGRLTSVPQEIQAAIISRVVAFEAIEDDYHPDPIVSPSSRSLKNPPQLPKIPMAKIFTFTNEVCAIHDAWELTLAEAFEAMDANQDGSVSFDELLKYSRMNRELFQLMIGTGNRKTKGLIEYDAARVAEYDQVAHPEHPLPVLK